MINLDVIRPGSVLLLHSSLSRSLKEQHCTPIDILYAVLERLGSAGTLIVPLFNFEFTKGITFNIRSTPSHMGAFTEAARVFNGAVRTGHPVYSFAVIGAQSADFAKIDNYSAYGDNSPFGMLRKMDGDIAVLDLPDQNSMTFYHHVEEMTGVPYRYHKPFTAPYTDAQGITEDKTYSIFVRNLERNVLTSVDRMGEKLWSEGLYRGDRPRIKTGLRAISAQTLFNTTKAIIEAGKANEYLYEISRT
ncbi:MAG: AAC(3) family N-acetyltransferase [Shinella zoogloeoides]|uniref:AAC(3) family N-acetyltransferase n=1 Tax=Shinella zoogloeoides TaxID=352475 RepID=UPI003C713A7B